jgi:hypothetical protein
VQIVLSNDSKLEGHAVRQNALFDLALIDVTGAAATPLPLGDIADLAQGDKVMIIGSPLGLEFTVHEGSVSSLQRSAGGIAFVQLDAKVNPGNSGGPVIDARGRVVGVVTLKVVHAEGISLALPINYAYSPPLNMIGPPSPVAASSAVFTQMLSRARTEMEAAETTPAGAPAELDDLPMLVATYVDKYQRLVVQIVRVATIKPRFEEIAAQLRDGPEAFCTIKGDVSTWKEVPSPADLKLPPALFEDAARRGKHVFVGEAPLRWDLCHRDRVLSGIYVELMNGHPQANRIRLSR